MFMRYIKLTANKENKSKSQQVVEHGQGQSSIFPELEMNDVLVEQRYRFS